MKLRIFNSVVTRFEVQFFLDTVSAKENIFKLHTLLQLRH